jgi:signal transduction histidine kinase
MRGEWVHLLLYVVHDQPDAVNDEARLLAESLGEALSLALQNVQFYTTLQREVSTRQHVEDRFWSSTRKTETLYFVSRSLIDSRNLDDILPALLNSLASALRADRTWLLRCDLANQQVIDLLVGGMEHPPLPTLSFDDVLVGVVGEVMREGRPIFLSKETLVSRVLVEGRPWYVDEAAGAVAVAPLLARDQACGVLMAVNRPDQRDFTQPDVDLLMATAAQIVTAMQNAHLFRAVAEERERLRTVVQSSRDGVVLLGIDLRLLVINRPALRFLGLPGEPEMWVDRALWDAINHLREHSPHVVKVILDEMRRIRAGDDQSNEGEAKVGLRTIQWLSWPVRGFEQPLGRLLMLRDVTEARFLEQFREDLTHTMVHDLRNPLTGIYAALTLLSRSAGASLLEGQRRVVDIALVSTERMVKLVNAILDISRLETGQMPLTPTVFRFSDLVSDLEEIQRPLANEHELHFVNQVPENTPLVRADKDLIERVLQNLIGNALKFTPAGGEVSVAATVEPEVPDKLRVSISDTGPGIPPEIRRNLFTKFVAGQQIERGSGLGLAFCRMVLDAHGEQIWVSKTSEQGTTFTFTLSLAGSAL